MGPDLSILRHHLEPLRSFLDDPAVREVVINRPGEIGVETSGGWSWVEDQRLTPAWISTLARAAAAHTGQDVGPDAPLCSTSLPGGARCQVVLAPVAQATSLTIRRPMGEAPSLSQLEREGLFAQARGGARPSIDGRLAALQAAANWQAFFRLAVGKRRTILVSGATGSGKTTLARALIALIPDDERLVTIEDTRELDCPHRNCVYLTWARGGQARAKLSAGDLLEAALRMRPDRILIGEIRDGPTAHHFVRNLASGHPGSIATVHAATAAMALDQLSLLVKEAPAGRDMPRADVRQLLDGLIDIVVQMERRDGVFQVVEVRHGASRKPSLAA